ncbi:hypothetical protein IC762_05925 [Bradyrhizobium genosp. L]|uniref:hypothetical protein n=1 Tax=Bradyrhizobium genosp. L TaxID=83637 RepID=UPI0018A32852|nr:hypothetical protein [Bradyrhizobium genosp. L]QPF85841.1 hypothetical protein IC762_05925 [Bradyrhizobium genosp. L]
MLHAHSRTLAVVALLGFCASAGAQESCPELARLNADAEAALKKASRLAAQDRCDAYVHYSVAWADLARYARDHREPCGISAASLSDIDKGHRRAVTEREDACGGLRRNPALLQGRTFPPEIIRR